VKIVTGAEASQFKSMRFRNYCNIGATNVAVSYGPAMAANKKQLEHFKY
jgi:hypothetical protein